LQFIRIYRESDRQATFPALFCRAFADELTQFFLKTCASLQTDCQRGGLNVTPK
jgi:hypothetical protein